MLIILLLLSLFFAPPALAINCSARPLGGNVSIDAACSFPNPSIDGVDTVSGDVNTAILTVTTGGTLTISAAQTVAVGSLSLTGGSIVIINTGQIKIGTPLYITDADGDSYPTDPNGASNQFLTSAAGRVRRATLTNLTPDCNDTTNAKYQNRTCYYDGDNDGFRTTASATRCVGADCTNSSDAYKRESTATIDCDDAAYSETNTCCTLLTWYRDADADGYGNPSITTSSCTQPAGYVSNNTDCYDSNANAKPNQTNCYSSHRGDGSFDYDCNGSAAACNSCSTGYSTTASLADRSCVNNYCYNSGSTFTGYTCSGETSSCGASGYSCSGSQAAGCVYNPCSLHTYYATGVGGCNVACK